VEKRPRKTEAGETILRIATRSAGAICFLSVCGAKLSRRRVAPNRVLPTGHDFGAMPPTTVTIGQTISHYRLLRKLGGGGMGVVYEAEDLTLGRHVALKFLPDDVAGNEQALQRFRWEARAASALNHPNICTVYEVAESAGQTFISMELLEGNTLGEVMEGRPLPLEQVLDVGIQTAEALDAAHVKGVLHRDIKPGNIFLLQRGPLKLLDFGVAKPIQERRVTQTIDAPTSALTVTPLGPPNAGGLAAGTVSYMSPEQALNKELDARSDVFSLGVVLYLMTTARLPFPGETAMETFDAILHRSPQGPAHLNPDIPPELERIVNKAIEKDRDLRYQSAAELSADLKRLKRDLKSGPLRSWNRTTPIRQGLSKPVMVLGAIAVAAASVVSTLWLHSPAGPTRVVASLQLTTDALPKSSLVTDGSRIYFSEEKGGQFLLQQVSAVGGESAPVETHLAGTNIYDISPDHSALLIASEVGGTETETPLWQLPIPAGSPRRVGNVLAHAATWTPDGQSILYGSGFDLFVIRPDGSEARKLTTLPGPAMDLRFSPDGRRIRFTLKDAEKNISALWEVQADGKKLRPVLPAGWNQPSQECCGNWTHDGKYFFFESTRGTSHDIWVLAEKASLLRGRNDAPQQLTAGPLAFLTPVPQDGKNLFVVGQQLRFELQRYDQNSRQFLPYLGGISAGELDFTRDGKWLTYVRYPDHTLWRSKPDGGERSQLTYPPLEAHLPHWSPDGTQIAFMASQPGQPWKLYLASSQGGPPQLLTNEQANEGDLTWMPDGKALVYGHMPWLQYASSSEAGIETLDMSTRQITPIPGSQGLFSPRVSPDGRYLAALSADSKKLMLYEFTTRKWSQLATATFAYDNWSHDSRYIYLEDYSQGDDIVRVNVPGGALQRLESVKDVPRGSDPWASWFGLGSDDAPLLMRDQSSQEIYALDLQLR
jgi:eukaryotic-like serine/threonine-protein kinase